MSAGGPGAFGLAHYHPTGNAPNIEAQLLEQGEKDVVEFVAIAAALFLQQFSLDGRQVDRHRFARQRRQVFEREYARVTQLQLTQGIECRRGRCFEP